MTGHDLAAWLLPGDSGPQVLASVEIVTGRTKRPTATEQELYEAIPRRHTNRWPYDNRHPVPPPILVAMQNAAATEEATCGCSAAPGPDMAARGSRSGPRAAR